MKILGDSENFGKSWLIWKTWRKILENLEKLSKTQENSVRLMGINLLKILEYLVIISGKVGQALGNIAVF